jgi:excisionase family DNA binding protein
MIVVAEQPRVARRRLTPRQAVVLGLIRGTIAATGESPSFRELAAALGCASLNAIADHLAALERKGLIERAPTEPRGIRLTDAGRAATATDAVCPRLGQPPATPPVRGELLTVCQAAERLRLRPRDVYYLTQHHKLAHYRAGPHRLVIDAADVERYLRGEPAPRPAAIAVPIVPELQACLDRAPCAP